MEKFVRLLIFQIQQGTFGVTVTLLFDKEEVYTVVDLSSRSNYAIIAWDTTQHHAKCRLKGH
jgi:hypothetical protein